MTKKAGETKTAERKAKQIVVRFDQQSYEKISMQAKAEHRGLGEFVRHAALDYIERIETSKEALREKEGTDDEQGI